MKFLHRYKDYEDFDRDYNGESYVEPWVSVTQNVTEDVVMDYYDFQDYSGDRDEFFPNITINMTFTDGGESEPLTFGGGVCWTGNPDGYEAYYRTGDNIIMTGCYFGDENFLESYYLYCSSYSGSSSGLPSEWSACPQTVVVDMPNWTNEIIRDNPECGYTEITYTNPVMADIYDFYGIINQYPVYTLSGDVSGYPQNIYCDYWGGENDVQFHQCRYLSQGEYLNDMVNPGYSVTSIVLSTPSPNRVDYNKATMPYIIIDANDYYGGNNPEKGAAKSNSSYPANVPYNIVDTNLTFDYFDIYEESTVGELSSGDGELKKGDTSTTKATASNIVLKPFKIIIRNYYQGLKGDETTYEQIAYGFLDPFYTNNGYNLYYNDEPTLGNNPIPLDGDKYSWYVFAYTGPTTIMWGVEEGDS